jgi:hypothetical protein
MDDGRDEGDVGYVVSEIQKDTCQHIWICQVDVDVEITSDIRITKNGERL